MTTLKINIIGAGKLGKTIARLLVINKVGIIEGVCNRSLESSNTAVQFIGQGKAYATIADLPSADIVFITTSDDLIEQCANELSKSALLKPNTIVLHCSGTNSSSLLNLVKAKGCYVASVHPMRSFANPSISVERYNGTFCAIEGDEKATVLLFDLFKKIGSIPFKLEGQKKALYHAAGVFASNYLVAICEKALHCLREAGVNDEIATQITLNLMSGTLQNLQSTLSTEKSLTGPIKRGDSNTISKHLEAFSDEALASLYKSLGLAIVGIAKLPRDKEDELKALLSSDSACSFKAKL